MAYISQLYTDIPRFANVEGYARIVKDKSILRRLITASNSIMANCFDDDDEAENILDKAEKIILAVGEARTREGFVHILQVAQRQFEHIEELSATQSNFTGIETGFDDLDRMTAGLQRQELIIIAARPSMGKTAFSLNIAQNAATRAHYHGRRATVGIFSLEMSKEQLVQRLLCSHARIDAHRLRTGNLSKEDWRKLANSVSELGNANIFR
jgi:replicative DNA helicase